MGDSGEWEPTTPGRKTGRRLDAYGFEVREEFAELYDQFEPSWAEEEEERSARWEAFVTDLRAQPTSSTGASDAALIGGALDDWHAAQRPAPDAPASVWAQRLGTLVQAGIPRALRPLLWPCLLRTAALRRPGEYAALAAHALAGAPHLLTEGAEVAVPWPSGGEAGGQPGNDGDGSDPGSDILAFHPPSPLEDPGQDAAAAFTITTLPSEGVESGTGGVEEDCAPGVAETRRAPGAAYLPVGVPPPPADVTVSLDNLPSSVSPAPPSILHPDLSPQHGEWLAQVDKDLHRTFPGHSAMGAAGRAALRRMLAAYAARNPAVGYCQGLNFVAATFLLVLGGEEEEEAFWCLCSVVERVLPGYFDASLEVPALDAQLLAHLVRSVHPATAAHLAALEVDLGSVALHWFLCLFVTSLPAATCLRVWDVLFLEASPVALFRVALALLDIYGRAVCDTRESSDAYMLLQALAPMSMDAGRLVDTAAIGYRHIRHSALGVLRDKYRREAALRAVDAGHHLSGAAAKEEERVPTAPAAAHPAPPPRDLLEIRSPVKAPPPRRRTISAAAVLEAPGRHLRAFLLDRRRPGVAAALEEARPSPARPPPAAQELVRTPLPWALARASDAAGVAPRTLRFGDGDGVADPAAALEASRRLLRRHTVACEATVGPEEIETGRQAEQGSVEALRAELALQLSKVSELRDAKESMLHELRSRCTDVASRLGTLEGDMWAAQDGVERAKQALRDKRDTLRQGREQAVVH